MASSIQVPVVIIGGGIVGLSASLCLLRLGICPLVVERHSRTSIHPRARGVNARTMELYRRLGIDDLIREAGASISPSHGIYSGSSLMEVIDPKPRGSKTKEMPLANFLTSTSPTMGTRVTQDQLEPVLMESIQDRGGSIDFNNECVGIDQDDEGVSVLLRNRENGSSRTIRAEYVIAADGANSSIRTRLNVPTTGCGSMGHALNILFHADLKSFVHQREFSICLIHRPEVCGLFTSINNNDRWVFHLSYDPTKGEQASDFTPSKCIELLHIALGMPEISIEIESILPWEPSVKVAKQIQLGNRIFLAGDAAHQMPPWGGMGANTGIADVWNLAWKLAAVLNKQASKALLKTYEAERLPVGLAAAEASAMGSDERGLISVKLSWTVIRGFLKKMALMSGHGYGYSSKAICREDTSPLGGWTWKPWTLPSLFFLMDGRPGRRAPHIWIEHQGNHKSTLDLFGTSFVLLAGQDGEPWLEASKEVASTLGVNLAAYCAGPEGDIIVPKGIFETAAGISSKGAILVRPDDFVVWRERRFPSSCVKSLEQAMRQSLCLQ
jgi:putative polyketide hydroxylase